MPCWECRDAHDYAERIRERLPRRLQEVREAAGLSRYALAKRAGVSLEMVSRMAARLATGPSRTPVPLFGRGEDSAAKFHIS